MNPATSIPTTALFQVIAICLMAGLGCESIAAQAPLHRYQVEVSRDLSTLRVRATLAHRVPRLRSRHTKTGVFVSDVQTCQGQVLTPRGRQIELPTNARCVQYQYDMATAGAENASRRAQLAPVNRLASPAD